MLVKGLYLLSYFTILPLNDGEMRESIGEVREGEKRREGTVHMQWDVAPRS